MIIDAIIGKRRTKGDSNAKSMLKAISWRIVGTVDTIILSWLITGKLHLALSIGSVEVISKMILYYFHERVWNKIEIRKKDDE